VGNLIVCLPGTRKGARRLLMAHLDTVPLCVGSQPKLTAGVVRSKNPKSALGGDDRSGAAVLLTALLEILAQGLAHPPLTFFWPVQEEIGLYGARFVRMAQLQNPKLGFNWDGGPAGVACVGATGAYDLEIELQGIASHAGVCPEGGASAIAAAARAIARLDQQGWHGLVRKGRDSGTSNIGIISGGDATNVVTSCVRLRGEVRSHDRRFRKRLVEEFRKAFVDGGCAVQNAAGKHVQVSFKAELKYESFHLADSEPCVVAAMNAIRSVGLTPQTRISNGGLDANWLSARGLPTVTLGSGQQDVHTVDEALLIEEYLQACRIALVLAT
jgi:tripeptide aminopeptidase